MLSTLGLTAVLGASSDVVCDACPPDMTTAPSDNPCGFECLETVYNCDACPDYMLTVPADNSCGFDCLDYDWQWHGEGRRRRRLEEKLAVSSRRRMMAWPDWAQPGSVSWPLTAPAGPSWPAPAPSWPAPSPGGSWPAPSPGGSWPAPAPVAHVTGMDKWQEGSNGGNSWTNNGPNGSSSGFNTHGHHNQGFHQTRADGGTSSGQKGSWGTSSGTRTNNANGSTATDSFANGNRQHVVHHDPNTGVSSSNTSWGSSHGSRHTWTSGRRLEALEGLVA